MRFRHVSLTAQSADVLAAFYRTVFSCEDIRPPKHLTGELVSRGNGLPNSEIYSIWLSLPGVEGPFLELLEYKASLVRPRPEVNAPGCGHLAFQVRDILAASAAVLKAGGSGLGEITNFGTAQHPYLIVYMRDLEGNLIELEQG